MLSQSHITDNEGREGKRKDTDERKILTPSRPFSPIVSSAQEVNGAPGEHSLFPSSSPLFSPLFVVSGNENRAADRDVFMLFS